MKFMDKPLWLCLICTDKRQGFHVFFDGTCPVTVSYVHEFLKCPAAQIIYWLLKCGFVKADVEAFLTRSFSNAQLLLCPKAKYNPEIKLAQVKTLSGDMDIVTASRRKDTFINPDLGLSAERIAIRKAQLEATVCNLGKYDFSRPQDLRSLHGDGSVGEWSADGSLAASIYHVNDPAEVVDVDDDTVEEDEVVEVVATETEPQSAADTTRKVQFEMVLPSGKTSTRLILPVHQQGASSLRQSKHSKSEESTPPNEIDNVVTYRQFAQGLWSRAPEDYTSLFAILNTLEKEYVLSVGGDAFDIEIEASVEHLVDNTLRQQMMDATDEDVVAFID
jgi:hypothetical protein